MSERTISLHTFSSVKGGVGKSTLAVVCAKILAKQSRVPVLVDCDLTGTSLADGLDLRAPELAQGMDGAMDLAAGPTGELYSLEETRRLRGLRRDAGPADRAVPPVYFNDVLERAGSRERPVRVDAALWRHVEDDGVAYLPSSSIQRDIARSLDWLNGPDPFVWARCFLWALDDLALHMPELTDVVVDLPPGTWGFPHEAMVIVATLLAGKPLPDGYPRWHDGPTRWRARPFLITSSDGNDLLPAIEYRAHNLGRLPELKLLANRFDEGDNEALVRVSKLVGPALAPVGLNELITRVPYVRELATLFKIGNLALGDNVMDRGRELGLGGAP